MPRVKKRATARADISRLLPKPNGPENSTVSATIKNTDGEGHLDEEGEQLTPRISSCRPLKVCIFYEI